jgi:photosystem II stability/assembly factor-like uncharacterized protein
MRNKSFAFGAVFLIVAVVLMATFWFARETRASVEAIRVTRHDATPAITDASPNTAPNDLDTPIYINGTGFTSGLTVSLGSAVLADVEWVCDTTLIATVPWGLEPGAYTLTVQNSNGEAGSLSNAFTVTHGLGVWTTGGPYGGGIMEFALHPVTSAMVYALVSNAGLFSSGDAALNWQPLLYNPYLLHMSIDHSTPEVIYLGGAFNLYRTQDSGSTWQTLTPADFLPGTSLYPVTHPVSPGIVYVGASAPLGQLPVPGQPVGVYRSADYGDTWVTMTVGLTDTHVTALTFYPDDPSGMKMIAGTRSGNIFTTDDGGETWHWAAKPVPHVQQLHVNPAHTDEVWLMVQDPCVPYMGASLYKSIDSDLRAWEIVTVTLEHATTSALIINPSGTLWAAMSNAAYGVYTSTNGGMSWTAVISAPLEISALAYDPADPQIIYAGARCAESQERVACGVYQSHDGGHTWKQMNQGLAGLAVEALAVSPDDPDKVFAYTGLGLLKSNNGGHNWQEMGIFKKGFPWRGSRLAVDAFAPAKLYLGSSTGGSTSLPEVLTGDENGQGWHSVPLTIPASLSGWNGEVFAVASHPARPGRVLAGATFYPPDFDYTFVRRPLGGIYVSEDYGERWAILTTTQPISGVIQFANDFGDPDLVYAGTEGTGLLKSLDGGDTWSPITSWPVGSDCSEIYAIATHPQYANTVFVICTKGFLRSNDAGESWTVLPDLVWGPLLFAPTEPAILYHGTSDGGLTRSLDEGQTWEQVTGLPVNANIYALAGSRDEGRVILYVASSGGLALPVSDKTVLTESQNATPGAGVMMGAGVYRLTTIRSFLRLFLPVIGR